MPGHSVPPVAKVGRLIFLLLPCQVKANVLSLILKALHELNLLKVNIFVETLYHTFPLKDFFSVLYFVIAVTKDHGTVISVWSCFYSEEVQKHLYNSASSYCCCHLQ